MVTRLKVIYKSPEVDEELDKQMEKFFGSIGFRRWASGYDLLSFERDIAFEKVREEDGEEKVEEHASNRNQEVKLKA